MDELEYLAAEADRRRTELNKAFETLLDLVGTATSRIEADYFQLPVADADAVYRERVYCYELYHQLRCLWGNFPFSLGGEIDKQGNPHFSAGPYAAAVPDLLVHVPGNMGRNLAIVEAKSAKGLSGAGGDLEKLRWFCANAEYFGGVFLVYGEAGEPERLSARIRRAGQELRKRRFEPQKVARFLDRVVFCLFAQDVGLLPSGLFRQLVDNHYQQPDVFAARLADLFKIMAVGGGLHGRRCQTTVQVVQCSRCT